MDGNKMRDKNGFSLIEVMVAMTVLLIGILGVIAMQYYAIAGNATSRELRIATTYTTEVLDRLLATPYASMVLMGDGSDDPITIDDYENSDIFSFSAATGGVSFTRQWWIEGGCMELSDASDNTCNANSPTCTKLVTAPVSMIRARSCWTDKNGIIHSVTITRQRTNPA